MMSPEHMQKEGKERNRIQYRAPGLMAHMAPSSRKYIRLKDKFLLDFIFIIYIVFRAKVSIPQKFYVVETTLPL